MGWAWFRPEDPSPLAGRPLLDLGVGDGQTLRAVTACRGLLVGLDRSAPALRAARRLLEVPLVRGEADRLPFREAAFGVVLAADLLHHLDDEALAKTLAEAHRVLRASGRLVAWWYAQPGRPGPDAPRWPRPYGVMASAARAGGLSPAPLGLTSTVEPAPPTVGMVATRRP